jgi:hypothetical protein
MTRKVLYVARKHASSSQPERACASRQQARRQRNGMVPGGASPAGTGPRQQQDAGVRELFCRSVLAGARAGGPPGRHLPDVHDHVPGQAALQDAGLHRGPQRHCLRRAAQRR